MRITDLLLRKPGAANVLAPGEARKTSRRAVAEEVDVSVARNIRGRCAQRVVLTCALIALAAVAACRPEPLSLPGKPRDPREPAGMPEDRSQRPEPTGSSKRVAAKQPPNVLIADDGTMCVVPESRYKRTRVGDVAYCTWT